MNTIDAAHAVVHDYQGGSESLGPRAGISAAVLRNKVNPNNDTHHLTLAEATRITSLTNDDRILQAWAHERGYLLVKAPESCKTESDMSVLEQMAGFMMSCGEFGREIHMSLADGKVTHDEIRSVNRAALDVMRSAGEIKQRLEGMAE
jgi:hypothetical protein